MDTKTRREIVGELRGFFPGESENQKAGNAIEKALLIGMAYGRCGAIGGEQAIIACGIQSRYTQHLLDMLEGK